MSRLHGSAFGGQLLGCSLPEYGEVFYVSPLAAKGNLQPIRGGVPVLFPQFAGVGPLPKHGFARTALWAVESQDDAAFAAALQFGADALPAVFAQWPAQCRLQITAQVRGNSLTIGFDAVNTGAQPFSFTGGLHPYFLLGRLGDASIEGLTGRAATSRIAQPIMLPDPFNFDGSEVEWLVQGGAPLHLKQPGRTLQLSMRGFDEWMIWNPGQAGAAHLADLPPGDWQRFVCIEPVRVSRPVTLQAGESFHGELRIEIE
jgi:glucose-6-phosphate 1-epimerase